MLGDDSDLDALEVEIEETVTNLLALHQPMARDLRLLLAALKISNDLERMGDHAVNIAISARRLTEFRMIAPEPELVEMGRWRAACWPRPSMPSCAATRRPDAPCVARTTRWMPCTARSSGSGSPTWPRIPTPSERRWKFLVSRNLERVADLATNVAEDVVFLVEGKSNKHGAERVGQ